MKLTIYGHLEVELKVTVVQYTIYTSARARDKFPWLSR